MAGFISLHKVTIHILLEQVLGLFLTQTSKVWLYVRREENYSGSGRPLNGPPTTLLRVLYPLTVLKLAAMYDCEPEYSINSFVCIQCNKKCMSVVTVRLLNKLLKLLKLIQ